MKIALTWDPRTSNILSTCNKRGERCQRATDTDDLGNNADESQTVYIKRVMTHITEMCFILSFFYSTCRRDYD